MPVRVSEGEGDGWGEGSDLPESKSVTVVGQTGETFRVSGSWDCHQEPLIQSVSAGHAGLPSVFKHGN